MSTIVLSLYTPGGMFIKRIIPITLEASRRLKETGAMVFTVDPTVCDPNWFQRRSQVVAEEYIEGEAHPHIVGKTLWFVVTKTWAGGANQEETLKISCVDANSLLDSRIVAQFPEEWESEKEAPAQDIILEILREQMGSGAIAGRDLSTYLEIPANTGLGPTLYYSMPWQEVGQVIRNVIGSSVQSGTEVMLDVQLKTISPLKLRVVIGEYIGIDRSNTLKVSPTNSLLQRWTLTEDWKFEKTYLYGGGEGDDDDRLIVEVANTPATSQSPFNRIEGWIENSDIDTTDVMESWVKGELERLKTKPKLEGDLLIGSTLIWDFNIGLGDWLTAEVRGQSFVAMVVSYAFKWSGAGGRAITAQIESL